MEGASEWLEFIIRLKDAVSDPLKRVTAGMKGFEDQIKRVEERSKSLKSIAIAGAVFSGMSYALKEGLESLVEPAIQFEHAQNALQRATGASVAQIREFGDQAHRLAESLPVSAEGVTEAQATLYRLLGSTNAAMQAMDETAGFAAATNMTAKDAALLLGSAYETLGDRTLPLQEGFGRIADLMALLQSKYSTNAMGGEELARSFAHLAEASRTFGLSAEQSAAMLGVLNRSGLGGGRGAGSYAQELITQLGKLDKYGFPAMSRFGLVMAHTRDGGLDLVKTIANLRAASQPQFAAYVKSLGTAGQALTLLYQHYGDLKTAQEDFAHATGETRRLAALAALDPAQKFKIFQNTVEDLKESLGNALVPVLIELTDVLKPVLQSIERFAEAHPLIVKGVMVLGAAVATVLALGGAFSLAYAAFGELMSVFTILRAGILLLRNAFVAFDVVAALNPIGLILIAAAALAAVGYEVYKHWEAVKKFFTEGWGRFTGIGLIIQSIELLLELLPRVAAWGEHFIESLVDGIKRGIGKIHDAMKTVTRVIRSYLPFSPAERGPLRDLHRVKIVETIAQTLRPAAVMGPMAGVGLALAGGAAGAAPASVQVAPSFTFHVHVSGPGNTANIVEQLKEALHRERDAFTRVIVEAVDSAAGNRNRSGL